jgi:hypothetical protein
MEQWVGTWKLNLAKSAGGAAGGGPGSTSTVDIVNGIMRITIDGVSPQGQKVHRVIMAQFDGKEHAVEDAATPTTRTFKYIDDHTFEWIQANGQMTVTVHVVLSRDGKTQTVTTIGLNPQGQNIPNVQLYEKQ